MRAVVVMVAVGIGGCSYNPRDPGTADGPPGVADADPAAPDADPTAPDGAPDATPGTADAAMIDAALCPSTYNDLMLGDSRYRKVNGVDDWNSAVNDCADDGAHTHLAVLSIDAERFALSSVMDRPRFVGISDKVAEGVWLPVTDEDVSGYPSLYLTQDSPPWGLGEPDNSGDCVLMNGVPNYSLEDRDCVNDDQSYLCECDAYADKAANH